MPVPNRILLCVENDEDEYEIMANVAAQIDPELMLVHKSNGWDAMLYLEKHKQKSKLPYLIILDYNMPIMDGRFTLEAIKSNTYLKDIPVVIFSVLVNPADELFCKQHGVKIYIKPPQLSDYTKVITEILSFLP